MTSEELSGKVVPSNVLSSDQTLDLFAFVEGGGKGKMGQHIALFSPKSREGISFNSNKWNVADDRPDRRLNVSSDGLTLSSPATSININVGMRATAGYTRGKSYWELKVTQFNGGGNGYNTAGVCLKACPLTATHGYPLASATNQAWVIDLDVLSRISGTTSTRSPYGRSGNEIRQNDVIGFLLDLTNSGTLSIYLNGTCIGIPYTDLKSYGKLYPCIAMGRQDRNVYVTNWKPKMPVSR